VAQAEAYKTMRCPAGDVDPVDADAARARSQKAAGRSQDRRLAGTVRAQEGHDAAVGYDQRDPPQDRGLRVAGVDPADLKH
jgi:hypothetical protein